MTSVSFSASFSRVVVDAIILAPQSQEIFVLVWQDPNAQKKQNCWSVLLQEFKNSSHIFGETLPKNLKDLYLEEEICLQHVDDILITSPTKEASEKNYCNHPEAPQ